MGRYVNGTDSNITLDNIKDIDATDPKEGDILLFKDDTNEWVKDSDTLLSLAIALG